MQISPKAYLNMTNTNTTSTISSLYLQKETTLEMLDCNFSSITLWKSIWGCEGNVSITGTTALGTYTDGLMLTNANFSDTQLYYVHFGDRGENVDTLEITNALYIPNLETGNHSTTYIKNSTVGWTTANDNADLALAA